MTIKTNGLVRVKVKKHLPHGLYIELENGQGGIVRIREISWDKEIIAQWKKNFPLDWQGFAFPIPSQQENGHEYSLRLAKSDPWDEILGKHEKGQFFEGVVTSVVDFGAFVEIAPGLTGLLHQSQFPVWRKIPAVDLFWPGDKVIVTINDVNAELREISLGIPHMQHQVVEPSTIKSLPNFAGDSANNLDKLLKDGLPIKHILVVEDEEGQANAIAGWLRSFDQRVDVVSNAEKAIDFFQSTQPDIALVDIGLPGMSGVDLGKYILKNHPEILVVNVTDWAHANDVMSVLEELYVYGAKLLMKPLLPEDLVTILLQESEALDKNLQKEDSVENKLTLSDVASLDTTKSVHKLLERSRKHLGFEQIILFSLDPMHRRINIEDRSGNLVINKNAIPYLLYSPVRDVAEDRDIVMQNEINNRELKRFRYLLELCPAIESCIGVPIPTQEPFDYAVFAFDKNTRKITNEQKIYLEGIAIAIGASLDLNSLKEKTILMQRTALIGHLTRAMMHEINNLISPLLHEADTLKKHLKQIEKKPEDSNYNGINNEISKIQQDIRKLVSTTRTFGRIVAKGSEEVIRIDEIIFETMGLLRDISDRAHVVLQFSPPEKMIIARSRSVVLEQIFLNVALNAIQQIAEIRPNHGGWVKIAMELKEKRNKETVCQISVEDNGPGIHYSLWNKIFEAGFTTRQDGSGIGLYISRSLMEDIEGKVYVEKSYILSGTLFILEIPVHL